MKMKIMKTLLSVAVLSALTNSAIANKFPIPLSGFDYGLSLNGIQVANGTKEERVTIKGGESQKVTVPLTLSFTNMMNMIPGLLRNRTLDYKLGGSVHLPWFNIPFQRTGQANIR